MTLLGAAIGSSGSVVCLHDSTGWMGKSAVPDYTACKRNTECENSGITTVALMSAVPIRVEAAALLKWEGISLEWAAPH